MWLQVPGGISITTSTSRARSREQSPASSASSECADSWAGRQVSNKGGEKPGSWESVSGIGRFKYEKRETDSKVHNNYLLIFKREYQLGLAVADNRS